MNEKIFFRWANTGDDEAINALLRRSFMPGSISIDCVCHPSFFDAIEVEGHDHKVMVAENNGKILGLGVIAKRDVYLDGEAKEIGYLSRLRLDPEIRNTLVLARGYQFLKKYHEDSSYVPFYVTSIMEGNKTASNYLTSGRAGLPTYHLLERYCTTLIPVTSRRGEETLEGIQIIGGREMGTGAVIEALNRYGRQKQFFPVYKEQDLIHSEGPMKGLTLDDFIVAKNGAGILGLMALWDQSAYRQVVVNDYSWWMRLMEKGTKPIFGLLGLPPLPEIGTPVQMAMTACIAIEGNRQDLFRLLLSHALHRLLKKRKHFLVVGLSENDPLHKVAKSFLHITLHSQIYRVAWEDNPPLISMNGNRCDYFELGSL